MNRYLPKQAEPRHPLLYGVLIFLAALAVSALVSIDEVDTRPKPAAMP